jgi:hypothetical protein
MVVRALHHNTTYIQTTGGMKMKSNVFVFSAIALLGGLIITGCVAAPDPSGALDPAVGQNEENIITPAEVCFDCYASLAEDFTPTLESCVASSKYILWCVQSCSAAGNDDAVTDLKGLAQQCRDIILNSQNPAITAVEPGQVAGEQDGVLRDNR